MTQAKIIEKLGVSPSLSIGSCGAMKLLGAPCKCNGCTLDFWWDNNDKQIIRTRLKILLSSVQLLLYNANRKPTPTLTWHRLTTYAKVGVGLQTCNFRTPQRRSSIIRTWITPKPFWDLLAMLSRCYMVVKIRAVTSSWNFERDSAWWNQEYSLCWNKRYLESREWTLIVRFST